MKVGPFGGAIVREYQEVMLNNPFPRLTGTVPQARAYDLQYLTQVFKIINNLNH